MLRYFGSPQISRPTSDVSCHVCLKLVWSRYLSLLVRFRLWRRTFLKSLLWFNGIDRFQRDGEMGGARWKGLDRSFTHRDYSFLRHSVGDVVPEYMLLLSRRYLSHSV